jgi:hypothetical protein
MAIFLTYIFLKGPTWLRALALLTVTGLFLFGCLFAATTIHNATERTAPVHAHPVRTH